MTHPPHAPPWIIGQIGQSLDGRIATVTGDSFYINGGDALDHLHGLRAGVDAVLVGAGTVLADDPQLTVRRVAGRSPARVVIDPRGRVPGSARVFADDGTARFVVHDAACAPVYPPGVVGIALPRHGPHLCCAMIAAALAARGMTRILVEGGAATLSAFIDAGMIDELHVLVAPLLLGSGKSGLTLAPITRLAEAKRPPTEIRLFPDGDVLFVCRLTPAGPQQGA